MPLAEPDLLGLARQNLPLGEIRIGASKEIPGKKARQPLRLETFRFTTPSRDTSLMVAELYGGTPAPWDRRRGYWAIDTKRAQIDVWVPPVGLAVDTNMEMWGGSPVKCLRRCDGKLERRSGQPCMCPRPDDPTDPADVQRAYDERLRLSKLNPPRACKVLTRYNLSIPDLPGLIGVWKLNTGSANAARWSAASGEVMERGRDADIFVPASLEITWWPGQDGNPYPVPILRPKQSMTQMAAGELPSGVSGLVQQLEGRNGQRRALTTGAPAKAQQEPPAPEPRPAEHITAQKIADDAANATTREEIEAYAAQADEHGLRDDHITTPGDGDGTQEELRDYLAARWHELPAAGSPPQRPRRREVPPPDGDGDGSLFDDPNWAEGDR